MATDWSKFYTYDIETYLDLFSLVLKHYESGTRWIYEISQRRNQAPDLLHMLGLLKYHQCRMVGFNNESFDYPVLHEFVRLMGLHGTVSSSDIYWFAQQIFDSDDRFRHTIWPSDRHVEQVDLFKIMHFDNFARSTSLKALEMRMKSTDVIDLPFPVDANMTSEQLDTVIAYNCHDVNETEKFMVEIKDRIEFRDTLGPEWINYNDTKIGKQVFIRELESAGVPCFTRANGRREPIQTPRDDGIRIAEILIDVPFENQEFQRVHSFFKAQTIAAWNTKGFFKDITASVGGLDFHFGTGGIHASQSGVTHCADDDMMILDVDVVSYYPSLAIEWGFHPHHLGQSFVDTYRELKQRRVSYPKGSTENAMLKLALNGVYGDSNNAYSPFYDPQYTMAITINGQMLLCWLAELLMTVPSLELIQANTDGVTVKLKRDELATIESRTGPWEQNSRMRLETVEYSKMAIRDVNNYVAVTTDGKVKAKGAYEIDRDWHKDHSAKIVRQAAVDFIVNGTPLIETISSCRDPFDFMCHVKVPRNSRLEHGGAIVQNTSRYFISKDGAPLIKIMPPVASRPGKERHIGVEAGWCVELCNRSSDFDWSTLNHLWYLREAEKLVSGVGL